jgi:hypothetical protein
VNERLSVADHEAAAKSPVDVVDNVFDALSAFPTSRVCNEPRLPFASCQEFHVITGRRLLFENVRQIEIDPGKMVCIERIFVHGIHYKLDFHIHETKKEEGVFYHISRGWQIVFVQTANFVGPRLGIIDIAQNHVAEC